MSTDAAVALANVERIAGIARTIAESYQPPATGRPAAIANPLLVQELLTAIEDGNYIETACDLAGMAKSVVYDWIKRGEAGEPAFALFAYAVKHASARAESEEVKKVREAGKEARNWTASMTFLERRHPDRWARRSEDSAGPKVVVQIGVAPGDVQVSVQSSQLITSGEIIDAPSLVPRNELGE